MRKFLKYLGLAVLGLMGLLAVLLGVVFYKSGVMLRRQYDVTVAPPVLPTDPAAIARGQHLAATRGCLDCHGPDLGGAKVIDDPAMGRLYGPNLTLGPGGRGPAFSDADFVRAIRHGLAPDGRGLFLMPSTDYSRFTESDMADLIAYVKSVPPVNRARVPLTVGPVARALMLAGKIRLAADEIDHANLRPATVTPAISVEYGRYVAASCTGCHGPNLSGGKIDIGPPDWPPAANLTPHASGRLASWSEADFLRALRDSKRPDGTELSPVMPRAFSGLSETEMKALWTYLRTLPAVETGAR